jgi:hypothetical protein
LAIPVGAFGWLVEGRGGGNLTRGNQVGVVVLKIAALLRDWGR